MLYDIFPSESLREPLTSACHNASMYPPGTVTTNNGGISEVAALQHATRVKEQQGKRSRGMKKYLVKSSESY